MEIAMLYNSFCYGFQINTLEERAGIVIERRSSEGSNSSPVNCQHRSHCLVILPSPMYFGWFAHHRTVDDDDTSTTIFGSQWPKSSSGVPHQMDRSQNECDFLSDLCWFGHVPIHFLHDRELIVKLHHLSVIRVMVARKTYFITIVNKNRTIRKHQIGPSQFLTVLMDPGWRRLSRTSPIPLGQSPSP